MKKNGSVDTSKTVKAGCGIRYEPDALGEETSFDFTQASALLKPVDDTPTVEAESNTLDGAVPNERNRRN